MVSLKGQLAKGQLYVKTYWNTPKEGEYTTLKEFFAYCVGTSGTNIYIIMGQFFAWGATFFCGAIMGISQMDFYKIGVTGTIFGYIFMFMTPINMLIYENFGKLEKKVKLFAHSFMTVKMAVAVVLYLTPSSAFEGIMKGLPQILANSLFISVYNFYSDWFVRYKFGEKYGRVKPFVLLYGIPVVIVGSIIPYINYGAMDYTTKLITLHFLFQIMISMSVDYVEPQRMVTFITPNTQERQRFYSISYFVSGGLSSIVSMLFPIMAISTGGYTSLLTYKVFVPVICGFGVLLSLAFAGVKERVIEKKGEDRVKVTFFKGAKQVLKNKYLYITNISGLFAMWSNMAINVMTWLFVYSIRLEWAIGIVIAITVMPCNIGYLLVVYLIKRYERRNVYLSMRALETLCIVGWAAAIYFNSVVLFVIFAAAKNLFYTVASGAANGFNPEIMEYHQWKYGERCDSIAGIFGWITGPVGTALGYILPAVLAYAGYTSDWDVFYDAAIRTNLFNIYIWGAVIGMILSTAPFYFYDITREKNKMHVDELFQRVKDNEEESDELIRAGVTAGGNIGE